MGCAHKENQDGFTLVEISIVMIIIGLLIGGTFGGMKLIENMQVNKTVQDLKAIESAALTFKDTYGRLPGDIVNPAARLPNCTAAPCSTGGNGNRSLDNITTRWEALTPTMERFTFWHHLTAADLVSVNVKPIANVLFGEGSPDAPTGDGYRVLNSGGGCPWGGAHANCAIRNSLIYLSALSPDQIIYSPAGPERTVPCVQAVSLDRKIDDGDSTLGFLAVAGCGNSYEFLSSTSEVVVDLKGL